MPIKSGLRLDVTAADAGEWNSLLEQFDKRTAFHRLGWLRAVAEAYDLRLVLLRANADRACIGIWPCLELRKGPFRILGSPLPGWATVYLGPLFAANIDASIVMRSFLEVPMVRGAAYCYTKVMNADREFDLSEAGFHRVNRYRTFILDLEKPETCLWKGMESRSRNMIRKARKANIEVRLDQGADFVADFWQMSKETFAATNVRPTYSLRLLEKVCEHMGSNGDLLKMSAFLENRRIAAVVMPHDDRTVYYWAGAGYREFRKHAPSNLLMWECIREARRRRLEQVDLVSIYGGSGKFKRSFGPREVTSAVHWERSRSPLIALLKRLYERRQRRRQRLS